MREPLIGVLALQGAFREQIASLRALGAKTREIRQLKDLDGIDAVVVPGGESTTIGKLLNDLEIMPALRERLAKGTPVFGTCAGLILLCDDIEGSDQPRIGGLKARVIRNAFGRQIDSFEEDLPVAGLDAAPFPAVFIRAPLISETGPEVEIMATVKRDGRDYVAAVRQGHILAASFHPELTPDLRFHKYFLEMIG